VGHHLSYPQHTEVISALLWIEIEASGPESPEKQLPSVIDASSTYSTDSAPGWASIRIVLCSFHSSVQELGLLLKLNFQTGS